MVNTNFYILCGLDFTCSYQNIENLWLLQDQKVDISMDDVATDVDIQFGYQMSIYLSPYSSN